MSDMAAAGSTGVVGHVGHGGTKKRATTTVPLHLAMTGNKR